MRREEENVSLIVSNESGGTGGSAVVPLSKAMLCSRHLPMLKPQGHIVYIFVFVLMCTEEQREIETEKELIILSTIGNSIPPDKRCEGAESQP